MGLFLPCSIAHQKSMRGGPRMFVALFAFYAIWWRVVHCGSAPSTDGSSDAQWQAHDADAIARAIVGANGGGDVDSVLQQEVQSAEHGLLLALAIAGVAVLIVLAFCVGYWFGSIARHGVYRTTHLMAQRSGASADLRHGTAAQQFYGASQSPANTGAYQSMQTLGTAIPAPPTTAPEPPAAVLQHRQASAAAATLTDYSNKSVSTDRLASLRVERQPKK